MKKFMSLFLVLLLSVTALVGCGGGEENNAQKSKADDNDVIIKVWSTDVGAQTFYEEAVNNWNATTGDEKNIFIEYTTTQDTQTVDVAQQNGDLPHIFNASNIQITKCINMGNLMALDELPGGEEFLEGFSNAFIEGTDRVDGKTYVVRPFVRTAGLAYNKDLFKKAGIVDENGEPTPPKTIEELHEYAKKISALGNGIYGFAFPLKYGLNYTITSPLSAYFDSNDKELASLYTDYDNLTIDCSGYKDMYQWILDMKDDGSLFPDALTLDNEMARAYFAAGTVGMIPAISWDVAVYNDQLKAECDWDICQYPGPMGREVVSHWNNLHGARCIGKTAAEKNPEETMEVIEFLYSNELLAKMYESGINIPVNKDIIEMVDKDKIDPRFLKFGEFIDEEKRYATSEAYVVEGEGWEVLFQKVWLGELSFDAAIKDFEKRSTDGLQKAVERGEYDVERQKRVRRYLAGEDVNI